MRCITTTSKSSLPPICHQNSSQGSKSACGRGSNGDSPPIFSHQISKHGSRFWRKRPTRKVSRYLLMLSNTSLHGSIPIFANSRARLHASPLRSEERRVGKEGYGWCGRCCEVVIK